MLEINFIGHTTKEWYIDQPGDVRRHVLTVTLYTDEEINGLREALSKITPEHRSLTFHSKTGEWELG